MFLQAGYGHGHVVRQGSLLGARELPQAEQAAHAITGLLKLPFEPSMLWTADSIGRRGAHRAPVENVEEQCSRKANKRQILFSPIVRSPAGLAFRVSTHRSKGLFYGQQLLFQFLDACGLGVVSSLGANGRAAIGAGGSRHHAGAGDYFLPGGEVAQVRKYCLWSASCLLIGWQLRPNPRPEMVEFVFCSVRFQNYFWYL
jgi:hypothetical protein